MNINIMSTHNLLKILFYLTLGHFHVYCLRINLLLDFCLVLNIAVSFIECL